MNQVKNNIVYLSALSPAPVVEENLHKPLISEKAHIVECHENHIILDWFRYVTSAIVASILSVRLLFGVILMLPLVWRNYYTICLETTKNVRKY